MLTKYQRIHKLVDFVKDKEQDKDLLKQVVTEIMIAKAGAYC